MPWLLLLHIIALICWCGSLLYLPALIGESVKQPFSKAVTGYAQRQSLPRFVFTGIATPAALLAIAAGTAVFLLNGIVELWLLAKLTMVAMLVVGHVLVGVLVNQLEQEKRQHISKWCLVLASILAVLMVSIIWLVLNKPLQGAVL